ncbi:hypothetical protein DEU56DRAFT_409115 [Suillus clintonianus]|uniref:uncharacterized protein n=1 Tax=Suillus clintonianus TaxID=1904413 RepID=UPI001B86B7AD|nr:uncharacterized protein DEU56DRAFT_409115 [Suillus clintonianus]KAG2134505.1 hypothetical protein DEU56DRAFT_409115 [Suillus clintonianus]
MSGSVEGQSIRLEVIGGHNLQVPSTRMPAGIYVSIIVDSRRRWKSAVRVLSSDESVAWGGTVTLSSYESAALSVEIRASYEVGRMLGNGELIGQIETSWDELLDHGNEPFELSFPPVRGVNPSLKLKIVVVHTRDNQDGALFDSLTDCEIARDTDAGHARYAEYMSSRTASHLKDAVQNFQLVLDRSPVDHPDHAAALTNLAWARLEGYIQNDVQDIDTTTSSLREALALRPQGHADHALSLYNLILALIWCYRKEPTLVYIHESVELCCKLLPFCPEGTYLRSMGADSAIDYVMSECDELPIDSSDEGIHIRRVMLKLYPLGHRHRPQALYNLSWVLSRRFEQHGSIDDIDESIQLDREAVSLSPEGHSGRDTYLTNLAASLESRFYHHGKYHDLDEAISWREAVLCLHLVGHEARDSSLDNLGSALRARFNIRRDIDDINQAVGLHREALTLRPPGHPRRDTTFNNLAIALQVRYGKLYVIEDLNEAIDLHRELLRIGLLDDPKRPRNLCNLSSALCSRFRLTGKNENVEVAIWLCQESLEAIPSLHPERYFGYMCVRDAYMSRYEIEHNPVDLSIAVENSRLASRHPTCGFPIRIMEAYKWTFAAEKHDHGSALEAYSTFFELLEAHLATRSSTTSRREASSAFDYARSLPVDAASCAIRHDNLRHAVELVEQGRGQQWSLASRLKTPVEDLESGHPHLAHRFSELSKRVSNAAQGSATIADRAAAEVAETKYRKITAEWEAVVAEIRNLQDFSRFLLPPSYEDLQAAARHGPIIILIASKYSCNAIIVPTSGEPHHIPLSVTLADLENLKGRFARAIQQASKMGLTESRTDLIVLSRIVWDEIILPIVNVLEHVLRLQHGSRIWLCPTAAFTSIPLHAAHPFQTKADRSKASLSPTKWHPEVGPRIKKLNNTPDGVNGVNVEQTKPIINPE